MADDLNMVLRELLREGQVEESVGFYAKDVRAHASAHGNGGSPTPGGEHDEGGMSRPRNGN